MVPFNVCVCPKQNVWKLKRAKSSIVGKNMGKNLFSYMAGWEKSGNVN